MVKNNTIYIGLEVQMMSRNGSVRWRREGDKRKRKRRREIQAVREYINIIMIVAKRKEGGGGRYM